MTRPYEMPYYPAPPLIGIALNVVLAGVLVEYLIRTDPLALALSAGWLLLGVGVYIALERRRETARTDDTEEPGGPSPTGTED